MYFIDVQGTLLSDTDKTPIKGAREFIEKLRFENTPFIVITNNTKRTSSDFLSFLQQSGFAIQTQHYINPLMILKEVLLSKKVHNISVYGTPEFLKIVASLGFKLDYKTSDVVLVSVKNRLSS